MLNVMTASFGIAYENNAAEGRALRDGTRRPAARCRTAGLHEISVRSRLLVGDQVAARQRHLVRAPWQIRDDPRCCLIAEWLRGRHAIDRHDDLEAAHDSAARGEKDGAVRRCSGRDESRDALILEHLLRVRAEY